eukprot:4348791-Pyramimonas_sp.AAC.1
MKTGLTPAGWMLRAGTDNALKGCVNDAHMHRAALLQRFGFEDSAECIRVSNRVALHLFPKSLFSCLYPTCTEDHRVPSDRPDADGRGGPRGGAAHSLEHPKGFEVAGGRRRPGGPTPALLLGVRPS